MCTIAKRLILSVFAEAHSNTPAFFDAEIHWGEISARVGAVAEGLALRASATAPEVISGFEFHDHRARARNDCFAHHILQHEATILNG